MSRYTAHDASTGQPIAPEFAEATGDRIDAACEAAAGAFDHFASAPDRVRGDLLRRIASVLRDRKSEVVERCRLETGYTPPRVDAEFERAAGQLEMFAGLADRRAWDSTVVDPADPSRPNRPRPELRRSMVPVGPVAVFGACNFPLAISVLGNDLVAAFVSGNPVVVKSHPLHVGTCDLLGQVVSDAVEAEGLPAGVFAIIHGRTNETSLRLVRHPSIAAVGFTGSPGGGVAIARAALERDRPIPVFAELGSTNPVFVTAAAIGERGGSIAEGWVGSLRFGNGHMCTKPAIVIVPESVADDFVAAVGDAAASWEPLPLLGGRIAEDYDAGVERLDAAGDVTRITPGVEPENGPGPWYRTLHLYLADAETMDRHGLWHVETFGPLATAVRVPDDRWSEMTRRFDGSLTATLHRGDEEEDLESRWVDAVRRFAGRIVIDGWPTGMEIGPATHHGGPFPASLDGRSTSVGFASMERFVRPVCVQRPELTGR